MKLERILKSRLITSQRGLTLVEIIVVLIILSIVTTFLLGKVLGAGDKAKADINKLRMKDLKSSIEQFQLRYNTLPAGLDSLTQCTQETGPDCIPVTKKDSLLDAWNRSFVYSRDGDSRRYQIKTLGADGREGGEGVDYDATETGP